MKIILRNKEDFEKNYAYSNHPIKDSVYPKSYPCFLEKEFIEGGLCGCYWDHIITYQKETFDIIIDDRILIERYELRDLSEEDSFLIQKKLDQITKQIKPESVIELKELIDLFINIHS